MATPTPSPSSPAPGKASKDRRLFALVAAVILAALATSSWQMRPARRDAFPAAAPQVSAPAPPWAAVADGSVYGLADGHAKWLKGIQVSPGYGNNDPGCDQDTRDNDDGGGSGKCISRPGNAAGAGNSKLAATFRAQ